MSLFGNHGVFDSIGRFAGKAARNPIVEGVVGATLSPFAAAALGAAGRASQPGANFGQIAGAGALGGLSGAAGSGLRGALGATSLFGGGADALAPEAAQGGLGAIASGTPDLAAATPSLGSSLASGAGNAVKGIGSFVEHNPNVVGQTLGGVSNAFGPGARLQGTQADAAAFDLAQKKKRATDLEDWYRNSPAYHGVG